MQNIRQQSRTARPPCQQSRTPQLVKMTPKDSKLKLQDLGLDLRLDFGLDSGLAFTVAPFQATNHI